MRWAVEMRTTKPSANDFKQAFDNGLIVRKHLMRGTWQLIPGEDYWWLTDLFSAKALTTIKGWMRANHIDIPEEEENRIREILLRTAGEKGSVTKEDFAQELARNAILMDDHRLSYHIRFAELKGHLCSGDLLPMKATYALPEVKLAHTIHKERDESLMLLARKYFQSRQPATLEDFIWWSGLGRGDCLKGIELLGNEIHKESYGEREFYYTDSCRTKGCKKGNYLLIAPYDEYLIGYKSRDIVLSPEFTHKAHNNSGNFNPIIARDGFICGNWKPFTKELETEFFGTEIPENALEKEWKRYRTAMF